ncbi:MAG: hypothetical protein IPL35_04430 [Sphingobacteriales bacterium]|nr:hypothetical protein [Sphingobacteriales bacterium]
MGAKNPAGFELRRTLAWQIAATPPPTASFMRRRQFAGLIVDIYGDTAVLQIQTSGMERIKTKLQRLWCWCWILACSVSTTKKMVFIFGSATPDTR